MKLPSSQRGAAALAVAMILLFGMTLIAFFANRTMVFEQRTSANQLRATKAFEMADAGIEWAIARLNDPQKMATGSCTTPNSAGSSFRDRFANPQLGASAPVFSPTGTAASPGCEVDTATGALTCDCPANAAASLATATAPRFRVQIRSLPSDATALEVLARGCTNGDPCDPSSAVGTNSDATAEARVVLKVVPVFPGGGPRAGLISGSTTVISGSLNVVNTDTRGNGITINTGSNVDLSGSGVSVVTLPGTPPAASILDNDPSLLKLTNADADGELFFRSFLGVGFDDFKTNPLTKFINGKSNTSFNSTSSPLTCSGGNDCARAVSYWIDQGVTQFWVDLNTSGSNSDIAFTNGTLPATTSGNTIGTQTKPIVLATQGQLSLAGGVTAFGVLYAASASSVDDLTLSGGGNSTIFGSLITRGDFARTGNGNITIVPRSTLFGTPGCCTGLLIPVPGTWRDKFTAY